MGGMSALEKLGLDENATPEEVKAKWRKLCMIHHPDRGGNAVEFHELFIAFKAAMEEASAPKPCLTCRGRGKKAVGSGFSFIDMPCEACNGTGEIG